tara:strand:- start:10 stop:633 length:624 start_codon:yes stop_codon:yes gene_type:complete
MSNLPKISDIYTDKLSIQKADVFVTLMNQQPKQEWVKDHPFIRGYKYLPIERIEYLLKTIFKSYKIEITGQGTSFNGVWVTVRIHYLHPVNNEWMFHDGIGASQLQTAKGTSPADLNNINNGALSMAYPVAKTIAIKDAADHFGKLFGSDLNRKDLINYELDLTLIELTPDHPNWDKVKEAVKSGNYTIEQIRTKYNLSDENANKLI